MIISPKLPICFPVCRSDPATAWLRSSTEEVQPLPQHFDLQAAHRQQAGMESSQVNRFWQRGPHWSSESHTTALCLPQVVRHCTPGPPLLGLPTVQCDYVHIYAQSFVSWCLYECVCVCVQCRCLCLGGADKHDLHQTRTGSDSTCSSTKLWESEIFLPVCSLRLSGFNRLALYAGWARSGQIRDIDTSIYRGQDTRPHTVPCCVAHANTSEREAASDLCNVSVNIFARCCLTPEL